MENKIEESKQKPTGKVDLETSDEMKEFQEKMEENSEKSLEGKIEEENQAIKTQNEENNNYFNKASNT